MDTKRPNRRQRSAYPAWQDLWFSSSHDVHRQGPSSRLNRAARGGPPGEHVTFLTSFASKHRHRIMRWGRLLSKKRVVSILNLSVLLLLAWQMWSILRMGGDFDMPSGLLNSMKLEELPYPLNIVVQVHRKNITLPPKSAEPHFPGYVKVQAGTFRNKYPSRDLTGSGTFDGIFVITSDKCEHQWELFQKLANKIQLSYSKWPQVDIRKVSLNEAPIPIAPDAMGNIKLGKRAALSILKREVSYLDAHRRLWQHLVDTRKQRVLVLDDTLFPNERLRKSLPALLTNIDQESVARQQVWHYLFLRRQKLDVTEREGKWTMNPVYNHAITRANVSHGAGAYVLSLDGARFLLAHVTRFRAPLDVEIGLLGREFASEFVALSACNNERNDPFCPEIVQEIGPDTASRGFDCMWRRLQERRTAGELEKYFRK